MLKQIIRRKQETFQGLLLNKQKLKKKLIIFDNIIYCVENNLIIFFNYLLFNILSNMYIASLIILLTRCYHK